MRQRHDQAILVLTLALLVVGLGLVFSASARYGDGFFFLRRQLVNAAVGCGLMLLASQFGYLHWRRLARLVLLAGLLVLGALFFFEKIRGAQNWMPVLGRTIQPVEFVRVALVMFVAAEIVRLGPRLREFRAGFLPLASVVGGTVLIVVLQNDFGSGLVLCLVTLTLFYVGGVRILHLGCSAAVLVTLALAFASQRPHVFVRLRAFLHPDEYAMGVAYQSLQSVLYIGSGGLLGKGLGAGVAKYGYLPDPHTDFIFSVLGEETGFLGAILVLALFMLLVARAIRVARAQHEPFAQLVALGIGMSLFWYVALNVLVATRLFPVTGLPLPLLSYGGSAMVSHLVGLGVLLNISSTAKLEPATRRRWRIASRTVQEGAL